MLADSNAAQHEENQAKLRLQSKLRQVEEDRSSMEEQLEDAEAAREGNFFLFLFKSKLYNQGYINLTNIILGLASQINTLNSRLSERQKRIDEAEAEKSDISEKVKRRERDLEELSAELDEKRAQCDKSEKTRARIQAELGDVIHELENQRSLCSQLSFKPQK